MKYKVGHCLQVVDFQGDSEISERMRELGLSLGSTIKIIRQTPFGGPSLVQTTSTLLALREEEMACLTLKSI